MSKLKRPPLPHAATTERAIARLSKMSDPEVMETFKRIGYFPMPMKKPIPTQPKCPSCKGTDIEVLTYNLRDPGEGKVKCACGHVFKGSWRRNLIAFLLSLATCNPLPAWADVMEDRAVLLARVCTNETSWNLTDDCAAIYETIRHKADARGVPFERFIRSHNHRTMSMSRTQRRWIAYLRDDRRPAYWPHSHPWDDYLPLWRARLQHARDIIAGNETSQCEETPWTWGGRMDRNRARRMHLRKIDCGFTLNDFYVLPR